jgi:hypothetical protein
LPASKLSLQHGYQEIVSIVINNSASLRLTLILVLGPTALLQTAFLLEEDFLSWSSGGESSERLLRPGTTSTVARDLVRQSHDGQKCHWLLDGRSFEVEMPAQRAQLKESGWKM